MRLANRRDANHAEIADAFRRMGWSVADTSRIGGGFPDLAIAKHGKTALIEIKVPKGKQRQGQQEFALQWQGLVYLCRTVDDAIRVNDENNRVEAL